MSVVRTSFEVQLGTGRYIYGDLSLLQLLFVGNSKACVVCVSIYLSLYACMCHFDPGKHLRLLFSSFASCFVSLLMVPYQDAVAVVDGNGACVVASTAIGPGESVVQCARNSQQGGSDKHVLLTIDAILCAFLRVHTVCMWQIAVLCFTFDLFPWVSDMNSSLLFDVLVAHEAYIGN